MSTQQQFNNQKDEEDEDVVMPYQPYTPSKESYSQSHYATSQQPDQHPIPNAYQPNARAQTPSSHSPVCRSVLSGTCHISSCPET
jgi:hypothetical protein